MPQASISGNQAESTRLLALLETEQQARRELERRLLPGPRVGLLERVLAVFRQER